MAGPPQMVSRLGRIGSVSADRGSEVYDEIRRLSQPVRSFYLLVCVSTVIATYGLLANNTAVIIGAMLVAPLMGPIFGVALGLLSGDQGMIRHAASAETVGVVLAVLTALAIGWVPLRADFGPEILGRTQPTLYDILVALAAGLAGAYALINTRISPALPGVAIATALVPPLAACGLCLSAGSWDGAFGAFMLFAANFLAIQIASAFVFAIYGINLHSGQGVEAGSLLRRFGPSAVLLVIIGVFMTHTLAGLIAERRLSDSVGKVLTAEVGSIFGAQLSRTEVRILPKRVSVTAVVLTPRSIEPEFVSRVERALRSQVDRRIDLVVRSLISSDADRSGPVFVAAADVARRERDRDRARFFQMASGVIREELASHSGARLVDLQREIRGGRTVVTAVVRCPAVIEPPDVKKIESALTRKSGSPVRLLLQCVIARDVTSDGFVEPPQPEAPALSEAEMAFRDRIARALTNQIRLAEPGAEILEFRYRESEGRVLIFATARTPRPLDPEKVAQMQDAFRRHVHPGVELVVRYTVGAEVAAGGFLVEFDESRLGSSPR